MPGSTGAFTNFMAKTPVRKTPVRKKTSATASAAKPRARRAAAPKVKKARVASDYVARLRTQFDQTIRAEMTKQESLHTTCGDQKKIVGLASRHDVPNATVIVRTSKARMGSSRAPVRVTAGPTAGANASVGVIASRMHAP